MDYITCPQTKSQYKVNVAICRHCKRMKTCPDYRTYLQPPLFPRASGHVIKASARRKQPRRASSEVSDLLEKPEQLTLDL